MLDKEDWMMIQALKRRVYTRKTSPPSSGCTRGRWAGHSEHVATGAGTARHAPIEPPRPLKEQEGRPQ